MDDDVYDRNDLPEPIQELLQHMEQTRRELRRRQRAFIRGYLQPSRSLKGLTSKQIRKFQRFDADESMIGEQCIVCMNDLVVGTKMVRLDCHVDHYLCKTCAYGWFKNHKTCPTCRHKFKQNSV